MREQYPAARHHLWRFDLTRQPASACVDEIEYLDGHGPILFATRAIAWTQNYTPSNCQTRIFGAFERRRSDGSRLAKGNHATCRRLSCSRTGKTAEGSGRRV